MADWLKEQRLQQLHQPKDEDEEHQGFAMRYGEQVPRLPERLEQALSSAFNDLPNDGLRSLLLCMSMFSSGYKFEIDRLILKWIDEGLTQIKSEAEMFSQLEDRNVMTCVASNCKHKQDETDACQWQVNHFYSAVPCLQICRDGFCFHHHYTQLSGSSSINSRSCWQRN